MKKEISSMNIEEMVSLLDKIGYELNLEDLSKKNLIDLYSSIAKIDEKEKEEIVKLGKEKLIDKCIKLGDSLDLDLFPEKVLRLILMKAVGDDSVDEINTEVQGDKIEKAKKERNERDKKNDTKIIQESMPEYNSSGIVLKKGEIRNLKEIKCLKPEQLKILQEKKLIVGWDPVTKIAKIKED